MRKLLLSLTLTIIFVCVFAGQALAHTGTVGFNCSVATFNFVNFANGTNTVRLYYQIDGGTEVAENRTFVGTASTQTLAIPIPNDGLTHDVELKATWGNQSGTVNDTVTADGHSGSFDREFEAVTCPGTGPPGPQGPAGPPGSPGPEGPQGPTGPPGSTPEILTAASSLCPNGGIDIFVQYRSQYDDGEGGISSQTLIGTVCNGLNGANGQSGAAGPQGPAGSPGAVGANGRDGANGANGRDGLAGASGLSVDLCVNLKGRQVKVPGGKTLVTNPYTGGIICVSKATARKLAKPRTITIVRRVPVVDATKPRQAPFTP